MALEASVSMPHQCETMWLRNPGRNRDRPYRSQTEELLAAVLICMLAKRFLPLSLWILPTKTLFVAPPCIVLTSTDANQRVLPLMHGPSSLHTAAMPVEIKLQKAAKVEAQTSLNFSH